MPKVSVIIPNYNHARFLEKRIQSILNQTYQDFEVIYLDDASTDNSNQVFAKYADDERIQAIYNESNSGSPFKQWNKGIRSAKGDYVWIAESDDYADECFLAKLVDVLDKNPNVGLAYCHSWIVDETNNIICSYKFEWIKFLNTNKWEENFINIGKDECAQCLILGNTLPNASAVLIRRSIYENVGYVDENMSLCGDWMLWVSMLLVSNIAFVAEPFNYYRLHPGTVRHKAYVNGIYAEETYQVLRYILVNLSVAKEVFEQACEVAIDKWLNLQESKIPWTRSYRIYKLASKVDSKLQLRIVKIALLKLRWKLYLVGPLRIIVRYIKHGLRQAHSVTGFLSSGD